MKHNRTCFELRAALESESLTQAAFARLIGIERLTVWRWCDGISVIPKYAWLILGLLAGDSPAGQTRRWKVERHHIFRRRSYRQLASRFHPDVSKRDTTEEMKLINLMR